MKVYNAKVEETYRQMEKGESGTPHLQLTVSFKTTHRLAAMKKIDPQVHWEQARNVDRAIVYCMKEETRIAGPWEHGHRPVKRNSKTDWS